MVIIGVLGFAGWKVLGKKDPSTPPTSSSQQSGGACPAQPMMISPADVSLATAVLYPGQTRNGDYKPHGGLRFDNATGNKVTVRAPMDAKLTSGSRYTEMGELQILLEFSNDCGVKYRFDHLLTLSDKFQKAVDASLPDALPGDSRTTNFNPAVNVTKGEIVATAVGFAKTNNVSFDFGVYDLRSDDSASGDSFDQARYGVCWLKDWLPVADSAKLLALPAGDSKSGKTSNYC